MIRGKCNICEQTQSIYGFVVMIGVILITIVVLLSLFKASRASRVGRYYWYMDRFWARIRFSLLILVGHYQISAKIPTVLDVPLPNSVSDIFRFFDLVSNLELELLPVWVCSFAQRDYYRDVFLRSIVPVVLLCMVALLYLIDRRFIYTSLRALGLRGRALKLMMVKASKSKHYGLAFTVIFWTHSAVVLVVYRVFECRELDGSLSVLRADYNHVCVTPIGEMESDYATAMAIAVVTLSLYLILVPVLLFAVMRRSTAAIWADRHVPAVRPLYSGFKKEYIHWSILLLLEKVLLTTGVFFLRTATLGRVLLAQASLLGCIVALGFCMPFKGVSANLLVVASRCQLWLTFEVCFMLKVQSEEARFIPYQPDPSALHALLVLLELIPLLVHGGFCAAHVRPAACEGRAAHAREVDNRKSAEATTLPFSFLEWSCIRCWAWRSNINPYELTKTIAEERVYTEDKYAVVKLSKQAEVNLSRMLDRPPTAALAADNPPAGSQQRPVSLSRFAEKNLNEISSRPATAAGFDLATMEPAIKDGSMMALGDSRPHTAAVDFAVALDEGGTVISPHPPLICIGNPHESQKMMRNDSTALVQVAQSFLLRRQSGTDLARKERPSTVGDTAELVAMRTVVTPPTEPSAVPGPAQFDDEDDQELARLTSAPAPDLGADKYAGSAWRPGSISPPSSRGSPSPLDEAEADVLAPPHDSDPQELFLGPNKYLEL
jgi:hypothetical protein